MPTSQLRATYTSKYPSFSSAPGWSTTGGLGLASRDPLSLLTKVGAGNYRSSGNDFVQDISRFLQVAFNSRILSGLFGIQSTSGNSIDIWASKDMYTSSSGGAIMLRFIKALLVAGERAGVIAMPGGTYVDANGDRTGVRITFRI